MTLDGGYFGTSNSTPGFPGSSVVNVQFNGLAVPSPSFLSDRQLSFTLAAPSSGAGLYPISVTNKVPGSTNGSMAVVNLAVQPSPPTPSASSSTPVGTTPSSIAIDTAAGVAVVANKGSNDITVVTLGTTISAPALGAQKLSLCTGSIGTFATPCAVATAPVSVAVDNLRHLALVANSGSANLAVVDISTPTAPRVTALVSFPSASSTLPVTAFFLAPQAVGINPVSGTALVAFRSTINGSNGSNVGAILDMNQLATTAGAVALPPAVINVVNINNGPNPHIAVSSRLNWALSTPGGAGSLSIVDLGRQTLNSISSISCSSGTVTVTTTSTVSLRAGQPVLITGASPAGFNGIFSAASPSGATFTYFLASCPASTGGGGAASYSLPVATVATNSNVSGVAINDESQKALLVDPSTPQSVPVFVFNILDQSSTLVTGATFGNVAAAMNPLTNIGLILNQTNSNASVVDPATPTIVPSSTFSVGTSPADVAIDPATDTALVVTPGPPGSISMFPLGALRSPQIAQSSVTPAVAGSTQSSSQVILNSSLGSAPVPQDQTLKLIGNFPSGSVPRLDGDPAPFSGVSISTNGRVLTATLSGATLAGNGPRQYAIDVLASGLVSNAARLQVIQAVSLITSDCAAPAPQGVAINAVLNVAIVTEPGCNDVSMVSLSTSTGFPIGTGFGASPELAVGTTPTGVAVSPVANLAVVANSGSNSVSVVDMVNDGVPTTFTTDPIPTGVAINPGTGLAVVASTGASVVDTFPVATTAQTPSRITVQQGPVGVAIDSVNNLAVVANSTANDASLVNLGTSVTTHSTNPGSIPFPQGVAFDPITDTFMITASANNQVVLLNPNTGQTAGIRVGIGPSSIAYNFASGALVTANNLSGTMTVVDFLDQTVRGVFSLPSSTQFAVDIHPLTNLAVVADPVHNQVLLVPLPH